MSDTKSRSRKPKDPCPVCFVNRRLCICDLIPVFDLKTRISLIIHTKELKRTSNTGRLALKALVNSDMHIRGELGGTTLDLTPLLTPDYHPLVFFPSEDAVELTPELVSQISKPIHLIVPDGNWRQAAKVHYRHHELKHVQRVMIRTPNEFKLHMRVETTANGMATLQAIAHALGVIEGEDVKARLLAFYTAKLENTLVSRGLLSPKMR